LAIIAMSPLHRRRVRPERIESAGHSGVKAGSGMRRDEFVCLSSAGRCLSRGLPPAGNFGSRRRLEQDPAKGLSGFYHITITGELSTRATVNTGTISNHGFWRKCLTGSGVNDGCGSTAEIQQLPRSGSFTPPTRRSGDCINRLLCAVGRYSASAASWSEASSLWSARRSIPEHQKFADHQMEASASPRGRPDHPAVKRRPGHESQPAVWLHPYRT